MVDPNVPLSYDGQKRMFDLGLRFAGKDAAPVTILSSHSRAAVLSAEAIADGIKKKSGGQTSIYLVESLTDTFCPVLTKDSHFFPEGYLPEGFETPDQTVNRIGTIAEAAIRNHTGRTVLILGHPYSLATFRLFVEKGTLTPAVYNYNIKPGEAWVATYNPREDRLETKIISTPSEISIDVERGKY
ncbi:hypothetical protein HY407_02485 [Candidatus Gottesmanbacteria bacterium]|nr:hypothetical protein [Candidatus Gottesmanbacteria bacterium]